VVADSANGPIVDSHCHAWRRWPYAPLVPDEDSRGTIDQLLYEMDANGVDRAVVVCAAIDNNADNVDYVAFAEQRHADRLHLVADLDCSWSETYHAPGAVDRLRALDARLPRLAGFTHYLEERNDGWLLGDEADRLLAFAATRGLLVSLGAGPAWQADLRVLAGRHPDVPILCHALGGIRAGRPDSSSGMDEVLASASVPSIYLKVAGLPYCSERGWDYPWPEAIAAFSRLFEAYGPTRLCWGSDFPACTRFCTFRQSLEAVRQHCGFLTPDDLRLVLGGALSQILAGGRSGSGAAPPPPA
jgi:L-fuconolactonase